MTTTTTTYTYFSPTAACGLRCDSQSSTVADFDAVEELIGAERDSECSAWLCGGGGESTGGRGGGGETDGWCFSPVHTPFEMMTSHAQDTPALLKTRYLVEVARRAARLAAGDTLVLVIVGQHQERGRFVVVVGSGDSNTPCILDRAELEMALCGTQATVWLVVGAAAAAAARCSGAWASTQWTLLVAARTDRGSLSIGAPGPYTEDDSFEQPAPVLVCPPTRTQTSVIQPTPPTLPIENEKEKELHYLALDHLAHKPRQTSRETRLTKSCNTILRNPASISEARKRQLLSELQGRRRSKDLAVAVALHLRWEEKVDELGRPNSNRQLRQSVSSALQAQAEASGCLVNLLVTTTKITNTGRPYSGAASWLARIWEATGCPFITSADWNSAVKMAMSEVNISSHM